MILSDNHWNIEGYSQRITSKEWREVLKNGDDKIIFRGCVRQLVAKNLGFGIVEVTKEVAPSLAPATASPSSTTPDQAHIDGAKPTGQSERA